MLNLMHATLARCVYASDDDNNNDDDDDDDVDDDDNDDDDDNHDHDDNAFNNECIDLYSLIWQHK